MRAGRTLRTAVGVLGLLAIPLGTVSASAQTISPLVSEYRGKARGRVALTNGSEWPLDVVFHTRGFSLTETGELTDQPLAPGIHVKLSAMSVRIPAGQSRFVFYEATADQMPGWFVLFALFTGFPSDETGGLNVQIELPHVVYVLPKASLKESDLRARLIEVRADDRQAILEVENVGPNFGRILSSEVRSTSQKADAVPFPLLPGGRRRLQVSWEGPDAPERLVLKGRGFELNQLLQHAR